jgi:hypothetical protein
VDIAKRNQVTLGGTGVAESGEIVGLEGGLGALVAIDDEAAEEVVAVGR